MVGQHAAKHSHYNNYLISDFVTKWIQGFSSWTLLHNVQRLPDLRHVLMTKQIIKYPSYYAHFSEDVSIELLKLFV